MRAGAGKLPLERALVQGGEMKHAFASLLVVLVVSIAGGAEAQVKKRELQPVLAKPELVSRPDAPRDASSQWVRDASGQWQLARRVR